MNFRITSTTDNYIYTGEVVRVRMPTILGDIDLPPPSSMPAELHDRIRRIDDVAMHMSFGYVGYETEGYIAPTARAERMMRAEARDARAAMYARYHLPLTFLTTRETAPVESTSAGSGS